nr:FdtA/QdtA family cupin domain-containing protein [uncultured Moellerella sp.]
MKLINIINFNKLGDERGSLVSLEENKNIPFIVKRVYYIFDTKEHVSRGFHAHKELRQLAICVKGSCRFIMDNGENKEELILKSPDKGLMIEPMQWHEMHDFSEDCIIIVLASDYYQESDYIRSYDNFIEECKYVNSSIK